MDELLRNLLRCQRGAISHPSVRHHNSGYRFPVNRTPKTDEIIRSLGPSICDIVIKHINKTSIRFSPAEFVITFYPQAKSFEQVRADLLQAGLVDATVLQVISFWITYPEQISTITFLHEPIMWQYPPMGRSRIDEPEEHCLATHYAQYPGCSGTKDMRFLLQPAGQRMYHPVPEFAAIVK